MGQRGIQASQINSASDCCPIFSNSLTDHCSSSASSALFAAGSPTENWVRSLAGSPRVLGKAGSTLLFFPYFFLTVLHWEEKKMLVISIQFLFFVCWSQLQLRWTSNFYQLSVMFESSRASGYWNTAYSRDLPSPRPPPLGKWGKNQI